MIHLAPCLLEDAASFMKVQNLSDLRFLLAGEKIILAAFVAGLDAANYTLYQWNDALEYLHGGSPQRSIQAAQSQLVRALNGRR